MPYLPAAGYLGVEEAGTEADVRELWRAVQRHLVGRQHAPVFQQLTLTEALTSETVPLARLAGPDALQRAREMQGLALGVRRCSPVAEHLDNWVTSILCSASVQKSMGVS